MLLGILRSSKQNLSPYDEEINEAAATFSLRFLVSNLKSKYLTEYCGVAPVAQWQDRQSIK